MVTESAIAFARPVELWLGVTRGELSMKYLVSEIEGALLDAAVAQAEGLDYEIVPQKVWGDGSGITFVNATPACRVRLNYFEPSSHWAHGGPIIEREKISLAFTDMEGMIGDQVGIGLRWFSGCPRMRRSSIEGATPLVAAMRSFVAATFGDEVDL